jgi:hypothetical protein
VFWDRDSDLLGYIGPRKGEWAEWYNFFKFTGEPVLLGFNAAAYARRLEVLSNEAIVAENYPKWIIANFLVNNKNYTNKQGDLHDGEHIKYFTDYLVCKKVTGDSTHIINTKIAIKSKFSTKVKQGEEWVYFIALPKDIIYKNINIKGGYDYSSDGLNANSIRRYKSNTFILFKETKNVKMFIWLIMRLFKL